LSFHNWEESIVFQSKNVISTFFLFSIKHILSKGLFSRRCSKGNLVAQDLLQTLD
jgi:hypothetical protein